MWERMDFQSQTKCLVRKHGYIWCYHMYFVRRVFFQCQSNAYAERGFSIKRSSIRRTFTVFWEMTIQSAPKDISTCTQETSKMYPSWLWRGVHCFSWDWMWHPAGGQRKISWARKNSNVHEHVRSHSRMYCE